MRGIPLAQVLLNRKRSHVFQHSAISWISRIDCPLFDSELKKNKLWNEFCFRTTLLTTLPRVKSNKNFLNDIHRLQGDILIRAGAIFSSFGTALLIVCILILLIFPVAKDCPNEQACMFFTTAPEPLSYFVTPVLVAAALFTISSGVILMRFARWYKYKGKPFFWNTIFQNWVPLL